jgi:transcriptional regulator with XRE-family HTH domain
MAKVRGYFGHRMHQARIDKGITQEQLSVRLEVTRSAISAWENGQWMPTLEMAILVSEHLGFSLDGLYPDPDRLDGGHRKKELIRKLETKLSELKNERG